MVLTGESSDRELDDRSVAGEDFAGESLFFGAFSFDENLERLGFGNVSSDSKLGL